MKNLTESTLNSIQNHSIKGIPRSRDQIHPYYEGLSIANIPTSICQWLGCPPPADRLLSNEILDHFQDSYRHIIFIVVDGLGLEFLKHNHLDEINGNPIPEWKAVLNESLFAPLTSITPSTTSAALTTFWTGRYPTEHGIIGYELFLKEFGLIANMITQSVAAIPNETGNLVKAGFDPKQFLPVQTLGTLLGESGIQTFSLQHQSIANSGLSQMLLTDTQSMPYQSLDEMWATIANIQTTYSNEKTYTYCYWGEMDTLSHHTGPQDRQLFELWKSFCRSLHNFLRQSNSKGTSKTLFLLSADHGQIPSIINKDYDLHNHPEFTQHLIMMPSGETRLPYLFTKSGHEQAIREYLAGHWSGQFSMVPSQDVVNAGLFGACEPYPGTIERLGQYVVFTKEDAYWWWVNKENHLLGRHGGLSRQEMLVPFLAFEM